MSDDAEKPVKPKSRPKLESAFPSPPNKDEADAVATFALKPTTNAALVTKVYSNSLGSLDLGSLADALAVGVEEVQQGDLRRAEAMLYSQANALQAIFVDLSQRATTRKLLPHWDAFLRVALRAQNQCRMTLETLATIKNPPVVYARQANINNGGQQQVNNGVAATDARAPATNQIEQTELLEADHGKRMDAGATGAASSADSIVEAVGAVNGAEKRRREGASCA